MTMASFIAQLPKAELHLHLRDAIEVLGCRRIDHGYHVIEAPDLMQRCRDLDILFTVCPTTTLHTTPWRDLRSPDHAIRRMIEAGLRVTVNSDDPGLFGTDLNREFVLIADAFGLSEATLAGIAANAFSHNWSRLAQARSDGEPRAAVSQ
jgi:adenosine deaminase